MDDRALIARISRDPLIMGGRACIRGRRVTVSMILRLLASGDTREQILADYPYLENDDISAALLYASMGAEERELLLV